VGARRVNKRENLVNSIVLSNPTKRYIRNSDLTRIIDNPVDNSLI
jgi:hypothetical protein